MALFLMVLPVSYCFLGLVSVFKLGHTSITPLFIAGYSIAALVQVSKRPAASHLLTDALTGVCADAGCSKTDQVHLEQGL